MMFATAFKFILSSRPAQYLALALGAVAAFFAAYVTGRKDGRQRASEKAQKDYIDTRKRMDETEKPSDPDAARAWLAERMRNRK